MQQFIGVGRYGVVCGDERLVTKYVWLQHDERQTEYMLQHEVATHTDHVPRIDVIENIPASAVALPAGAELRAVVEPLRIYEHRRDLEGEELDADSVVVVLSSTADIATVMTEIGLRWARVPDLHARSETQRVSDLADRVLCVTMGAVPSATSAERYLPRANERHRVQVLVQVVGFLAQARRGVPGFRHNDLHLNNVLVSPAPAARSYEYGGRALDLRAGDPVVSIVDFGLSCSDSDQASSWAGFQDDAGVCDAAVAFFDLHRFFECLLAVTGHAALSAAELELAFAAARPRGGEITASVSLQQRLARDPACAGHVRIAGRDVPYGHVTPSLLLQHHCLRDATRPCAQS